jgi:SpoVK/Ycf46/Vps4 family AAA+-type ATPase
MIDIDTFNEMHPPGKEYKRNRNDLGPDAMQKGQPPPGGDDFILCLPATIPGYHMKKKQWIQLYVDRIEEVEWNTNAFNQLVIDGEKKRLIEALVTNQISAEESTDLMSGKGAGLLILLHGPPGTGKTLTAESVAEIAKKPLYRVTCGDVGTKPEDVEKYLETVLLLGKTWGCVVLLDEADVFLMQRSTEDFERNALVSVFLRVLEYYDGILILTSNRVGTLDAAFKSRIQLSLQFPPLSERDRREIWNNFIDHIDNLTRSRTRQTAEVGILSDEIKKRLPDLAKEELNGREIRNAVSTARQLAMFEKQPMGYRHLATVVSEMNKFNTYAAELQGGLTDDEIARQKCEY